MFFKKVTHISGNSRFENVAAGNETASLPKPLVFVV
jgi:hypothetical protein